MSELTKVSMNLTGRDIRNTEKLKMLLDARNNAESVSAALSIASKIMEFIKNGKEIIMKNKDGTMEKLIIIGSDNE